MCAVRSWLAHHTLLDAETLEAVETNDLRSLALISTAAQLRQLAKDLEEAFIVLGDLDALQMASRLRALAANRVHTERIYPIGA